MTLPAPAASNPQSRAPQPNFDVLAGPYRTLEYLTFGRALHRARTHFLPALAPCRRALILGDGDGRFTAALLAHNPHLHADAVDLSPAMLRALTRRAHAAHPTAATRLRTHCTDARTFVLPADTSYDLVVTHFFLDCLTTPEVHTLCRNLRRSLAPQAAWLLSDFRILPGALHLPSHLLIRALYLGFRILTGLRTASLPDHIAALSSCGFTRTDQHLSLAGILTSELWQLSETSSGVNCRP